MKPEQFTPLALPLLLSLAQCSPSGPPRAQAAAHYRTVVPTSPEPGSSCLVDYGGIGANRPNIDPPDVGHVPQPIPDENNLPTNLDLGTLVVDGDLSATGVPFDVDCRITGNGEIHFEVAVDGPNSSPYKKNAGSRTSLDARGVITANGTGSGTVSFFTTTTLAVSPKKNTVCTFVATPSPLHACSNQYCLGTEQPDQYGGLALTFYCPDMDTGAAGIAGDCEANGVIVLDRCSY